MNRQDKKWIHGLLKNNLSTQRRVIREFKKEIKWLIINENEYRFELGKRLTIKKKYDRL